MIAHLRENQFPDPTSDLLDNWFLVINFLLQVIDGFVR
jgi:hypothetical protein